MHFTRLRLSGFKSFVDPAELRIDPGLTGVVGPNGCGKSNLLEALRWVMGENSPKSMRGSGMDDVIFAGTKSRPSRNLAEVVLSVDNSDHRAPSVFNDEAELEVSRRIERESGSAYRINGKDVRARDVQLLFADAATGAHSPAMVSQGRVGALINARPQDRRAILEEAAGISGLHSRRNEAERRLRAAETNLVRLHDVAQQIDSQLAGLRRQAGQARRYKKVSAEIRHLHALHLYLQWRRASELLQQGEEKLRVAEARVAELTGNTSHIATEQAELSAMLPALRTREAEAAAALHRLSVARDSLAAEEQRLADIRRKLTAQMDHVTQDIAREQAITADTEAALERITAEAATLNQSAEAEAEATLAAEARVEAATDLAEEAEASLDQLKNEVASATAQRNRYHQEIEAADRRLARLHDEQDQVTARLQSAGAAQDLLARVCETEVAIAEAEERVEIAATVLEDAETTRIQTRKAEQEARSKLEEARNALSRISAERDTLARLLKSTTIAGVTPLMDRLEVTPGYETALGAALGDDLDVPLDEEAPISWKTLPDYDVPQPLPAGAVPLGDFVQAPAALARRLHQTGVVDGRTGETLAASLLPGQRLVNRDGALWRWDGFQAAADAPSPAATRLAQRNRLAELEEACAAAEDHMNDLTAGHETVCESLTRATEAERTCRQSWREAEEHLSAAHRTHSEAERQAADAKAQLSALESRREALGRDLEEMQDQRTIAAEAAEAIENLNADESLEDRLSQAREAADQARGKLSEARSARDNLALQARHRAERLDALGREAEAWNLRRDSAVRQMADLTGRAENARMELLEIEDRPAEIAERREQLAEQIVHAEDKRKTAADTLAEAEEKLKIKDRALHEAQTVLSEAREDRVRLATGLEQLTERRRDIARQIAEEFECPPQMLLQKLEAVDPDNLPPSEDIDARLEKLKHERERMGPVNLRAEVEVAEFETRLETLTSERNDLETAIARLRQAIGSLNREGRERLRTAFEQVNTHFGTLFTTLFGGGHAYLELTESDDPLTAGLEIMASPPGKRLQVLSLLSGGEQALTALSLVFAVFMTNPAPICVLDEVDAPLDDANVERFCDLLDDMVARTHTRFLIVTHNAVTMSRMKRLYGVTMAERGISQLVSVDLERAEALRAVG